MPKASPIRNPQSATEGGTAWVAGEELGYTPQHILRLYEELKPLARARKIKAGRYLFDRNHPKIAPRINRVRRDAWCADLSDFTEKQITAARRKENIVKTARSEIARRMADTDCSRGQAKDWFCSFRIVELPELDAPKGLGIKSFERWEALCKQGGLRALVDMRGRKPGTRITRSPEAWEFFLARYLRRAQP